MTETPKTEKNSNLTESTGKVCSACEDKKLKAAFSKKQWLEPAASRRCTECVTADKPTKPPTATAITKPSTQPSTTTTTTTTSTTSTTSSTQQQPQPKLRPNKTIPHARIQPKKHTKRPPLLDADGDWFLPSAEASLTEIFNRFDSDADGHWSIRETQSFATATNGKPFTTEELYEVTNHFFKENKLPLKGFLQFYHLQTSSHPAETWKDMQKLGYGWDVKSGDIIPPQPQSLVGSSKQPAAQSVKASGEGGSNGSVSAEGATAAAAAAS